MKPDKLTIHDLFQKERRYVVPLYQRAYVWTKQGQWEPLWEDIERQAEACLESENFVSKRSHFLGAIVLNVSKIVGSGVARSEIIDGQQRLTTLQVMIAALRDFAAASGSSHLNRLRRLTLNEDEKEGSDAAFKVWPTNADRAVFRSVLLAGSPKALLSDQDLSTAEAAPRLVSAYLYFYDRVSEFVGPSANANGRDQRVLSLLQALRTSLQLVVIELEDGDDPQVIFETLNARGQPLLPSDLIRNYVFLQAANDPSLDADDLYDKYWRLFDDFRLENVVNGEDRFWHVEERQGRLTRPRIDLFLYHYLVMKIESDLNIGQLFREFRDWRDRHPQKIEDLLKDLKVYSGIFERLLKPIGQDRAAILARRLKSLDNSTVFPLLLYLLSLSPDRLDISARDQILTDLESWLVRRFICWETNKNYNRFFVSLLVKLKRAPDGADLAEIVRTELTRSSDSTVVWPSDDRFLASWLSKPLYAKSRPDRSAMILRAIEAHLGTTKNEAVTLPDKLSVEHLLPQKGSLADYPYDASMPVQAGETPDQCRSRLRDTVGNLTLLTGELNASASNGPFPIKTLKIVGDSDLRLNAWLRLNPPTHWSEASILDRGQRLFDAARKLWPRPATEPDNIDDEDLASPEKGTWQFTDRVLMQDKRRQMISALGGREDVTLESVTIAKYSSANGEVRAAVAVSKRYDDRSAFPYWYAYNPSYETFLSAVENGHFLLGCIDREECYAIPRKVLEPLLLQLNTTTRNDTGKLHWHIHLVERSGTLALFLPKSNTDFPLGSYVLRLAPVALGEDEVTQ